MENPFIPGVTTLTTPADNDAGLRRTLAGWQTHLSADDYVEYSWHCPTVRLLAARPRLRPPSPGYAYPNWAYHALGGLPAAVDPGMFVAGEDDGAHHGGPRRPSPTRWRLPRPSSVSARAAAWAAPSGSRRCCRADFDPPVDLRWPEYVTTPRGEEWTFPTPRHGTGAGEPL